MKTRNGFVSNSSSTSFIITSLTDETKNIADFVKENPQLIDEFNENYGYSYSFEDVFDSAKDDCEDILDPNSETIVVFGDEDGTTVGHIFDYILRDGGESESFKWKFYQYNR